MNLDFLEHFGRKEHEFFRFGGSFGLFQWFHVDQGGHLEVEAVLLDLGGIFYMLLQSCPGDILTPKMILEIIRDDLLCLTFRLLITLENHLIIVFFL